MTLHQGFELFMKFSNELKNENRFFVNQEYLEIFEIIISQNFIDVESGTKLFRGRINKKGENEKIPFSCDQLGMPKANINTANGRANPYGINYFYLSSNSNTVIAELRPNLRDYISIGEFEVKETKRLVKLGEIASIGGSINDTWGSDIVCMFMLYLILSFTTPVGKTNNELDYLPPQYFSEYCKKKGYDGVIFASSVMEQSDDENYNYVFFNDNDIQFISTKLHGVTSINYTSRIESDS